MSCDGSVEIDQDFNIISRRVNDIYASDQSTSELFEVVMMDYSNPDDNYRSADTPQDIATLSKLKKYPKRVIDAASAAEKRVFVGAFPQISHLYCIVDNSIFIWPEGDPNQITVVTEPGKYISVAVCGKPESKIFNDNVTHVILVATNKSVRVIPANESILFKDKSSAARVTSLITAATISQNGTILIGSIDGNVWMVQYKSAETIFTTVMSTMFGVQINKTDDQRIPRISLKGLIIRNYVYNTLDLIIPLGSAIKSIAYDDTRQFMAVLRTNSRIHFYKMENEHLRQVSYEDVDDGYVVHSIHPIPQSDSRLYNFVSFTTNGCRIFYGTMPGIYDDVNAIHAKQILLPPSGFYGQQLITTAFTAMNSVFVFKRFIAIMKPNCKLHSPRSKLVEDVAIIPLKTDGLSVFVGDHILRNYQSPLFLHEAIWQHVCTPPPLFLMTASGYHVVNFSQPVDILQRLMTEHKGNFAGPVRDWMASNMGGAESYATAILLAARSPDHRRWALFAVQQFAALPSQASSEYAAGLSGPAGGFVLRAARILMPIISEPLFVRVPKKSDPRTMKYVIAPLFGEFPGSVVESLRALNDLAAQYLTMMRDNMKTAELQREAKNLKTLSNYLLATSEALRFINILREQKTSIINSTMLSLEEQFRSRLEMPFGLQTQMPIFDCLREFASALFRNPDGPKRGDRLSIRLGRECPSFFSEAASRILDALEELRNAAAEDPMIARQKVIKTRDEFLKYASQPLKLEEICGLYKQALYYEGAVDVALGRARALDSQQNALRWFKAGRPEADTLARHAFEKRTECYRHLLPLTSIPTAFDLMLKADDELFHNYLYEFLISGGQQDRLMAVTTPYLMPFLEANYPQLVYLYCARHKDYGQAATRLLEQATREGDTSLQQRIEWLTKVVAYAKGCSMSGLAKDAEIRLKCAQAQREYAQALEESASTERSIISLREQYSDSALMEPQALFDSCCQLSLWPIVLRLLALCPVAAESKPRAISFVWSHLIVSVATKEGEDGARTPNSLASITEALSNAAADVRSIPEVIDPRVLMPILEDLKLRRSGAPLWAMRTMNAIGVEPTSAALTYFEAARQRGLADSVRADFLHALFELCAEGADLDGRSIADEREWYIDNAQQFPEYERVYELLGRIDDYGRPL